MTALVIGIGHPLRGDDAVGAMIALAVEDLAPPGVTVLCHPGEGTDLIARWEGFDRVIAIDAIVSGGEPGTVRRWDACAAPLPVAQFPKHSHVFGLPEAVELARLLGRLPPSLTVIGVEGAAFHPGAPLHPAVAAALPSLAAEIAHSLTEREAPPVPCGKKT